MKIQLQSLLFPRADVCSIPELYYHRQQEQVIYDGYFNLFYIEKRKKYTEYEKLWLEIHAKGYSEVCLYHDGEELSRIKLEPEQERDYVLEFPYEKYETGCFWFSLTEVGTEQSLRGMFAGELSEEKVRSVRIGVDICTFRREHYVCNTLQKLQHRILAGHKLDVSDNVEVFVIDNGRTLDQYEPAQKLVTELGEKLHIIPNKNAGGSGGFTRGMMEILDCKEQSGFTHVLLMDDDAVTEPDTLVRLYGFLSGLKEEWKCMTVGGSLLREEEPDVLFCAGEWWKDGVTVPGPCSKLNLRNREQAACEGLLKAEKEHELYSGWWCCCYSLDTVRGDNLPIPFFIHHDDIEYGIRNRAAGITFLNGVNVWHRDVELSMPGVNMYYDVRNTLIEMALQNTGKNAAIKSVLRWFAGSIRRLRYQDASLVCRGIEDFLKGYQWLYEQEPEQLHQEIGKQAHRAVKLQELKCQFSADEWKTIKMIPIQNRTAVAKHCKSVVLYDEANDKAMLFTKDAKQERRLWMRFLSVLLRLEMRYRMCGKAYRGHIGELTNAEAWKHYLLRGGC